MNTSSALLIRLWLLVPLVLTACGGGGGGGGSGAVSNDPGGYLPGQPPGAGIAGSMDGTWRVTRVKLAADPRTRNPDATSAWLGLGEQIQFTDGRVKEDDDGSVSGPEPDNSAIPVTVEFVVNEPRGQLTLYGFGFRLGDNQFVGAGATRVATLFGTTSDSTAIATVVQEEVYPSFPGGAVDRFMVLELELTKTNNLPVVLDGSTPAEDAAAGPSAPPSWGLRLRQFLARGLGATR